MVNPKQNTRSKSKNKAAQTVKQNRSPLKIFLHRWNRIYESHVLGGLAVGTQALKNACAFLHFKKNVDYVIAVRCEAFGQHGHEFEKIVQVFGAKKKTDFVHALVGFP